jgi:diguanylate cyclase (GGDEF)-like protein
MKILIVDDSHPCRIALGAILRDAGYTDLVKMESAAQTLDFLLAEKQNTMGTPVDLILMDVMMPEIDGIEAVRKIKDDQALRDIPIIMVSAQDEEEQIEEAFNAGAIDYISKPLKKLELHARVHSALKLKEEMDRRKARERELEVLNQFLAEANQELQRLSVTDGLTGIANRRYFDESLEKEWLRATRDRRSLSLIMIDIDFFKAFNDYYGHIAGDVCLKQIATALTGVVKRSGDLVARYGGEEFVILLPGTELEGAMRVAEMVQQQIAALGIEHGKSQVGNSVTVSMGIATLVPEQHVIPATLIEVADAALYEAKKQGRNQIQIGIFN